MKNSEVLKLYKFFKRKDKSYPARYCLIKKFYPKIREDCEKCPFFIPLPFLHCKYNFKTKDQVLLTIIKNFPNLLLEEKP